MLASVGAAGPAQTAFADRYFDDANQASLALLLSDPANARKVQQTHGAALLAWLQQNAGYAGDQAGALAAFLALPGRATERVPAAGVFRRTAPVGATVHRSGQRLRRQLRAWQAGHRDAVFGRRLSGECHIVRRAEDHPRQPRQRRSLGDHDAIRRQHHPSWCPAAACRWAPRRRGIYPSSYGLITFGQGNVDVYSLGSVLLGTSRIFTTFGGGITVWSAEGDINAGQGTKNAVVAQPFSLSYDLLGDVTLAPQAPSTGAGIATLNDIPGTLPGDVDLIASHGTVDAGEAGIRASGNANLAALAIANGANIQVQGKTTGVPVVVAPNIGALSAAAAARAGAQNTGQQTAANRQPAVTDSIITVEVLGSGG